MLQKICARLLGPFSIIKRLGTNAYILELPTHLNVSHNFNVANLYPYQGTFKPMVLLSNISMGQSPRSPSRTLVTVFSLQNIIDEVFDDQIVVSQDVRRFLVHWKGRPSSDTTWITKDEFFNLDDMLLDAYLDYSYSESEFFSTEEE